MVVRLEILDCRCWSRSKAVEANISTGLPSSSLTDTYQVLRSRSVVLYRTPSSTSGSSSVFVWEEGGSFMPLSFLRCSSRSGSFAISSATLLQAAQSSVSFTEVSFFFLPQRLQVLFADFFIAVPVFLR